MTDDSLLGQLAEEFTKRVREGKLPDIEEYASCHPELANRIHGLFPTLLMLEGLARDSESTNGSLSEGQRFGRYHIIRMLGKGGMGEVYEAEDLESGRRVALKALRHKLLEKADSNRFLAEGRLAASINHLNCVYVYASEQIDGMPVISMELLPGGTLKDIIEAKGPLPVTEAVDAILQVVQGLAAAEKAGILHRDIKPSNCFIDSDGTIKIGDFGLSISTLAHGIPLSESTDKFCGTPAYSSPEQLRGENLDVRSDIYSVGATLYYLLTGKPPHEKAGLVQLCAAILESPPKSPRLIRHDIPRGLARIVLRCLDKRPSARYTLYDSLKEDLLAYSSRIPTPAGAAVRVFAAIVDFQVVALIMFLFQPAIIDPISAEFGLSHNWHLYSGFGISAVLTFYFALWEGLAGASIGKMGLFLRVAGPDGRKPSSIAAALRASVFGLVLALSYALLSQTVGIWIRLLFPFVVLYCVATKRNSFSGIHDLASKTRVVHRSAAVPGFLLAREKKDFPLAVEGRIGPYGIIGHLRGGDTEGLLMGYDDRLRRNVWIVIPPPETLPLSRIRRDLRRPGRLRWLNGKRDAYLCWDAYEAPEGKKLRDIAKQEFPWKLVPGWLLTLVEELSAGLRENTLPLQLNVDAIWIRSDARLILLECPAPPPMAPEICKGRVSVYDLAQIQTFLCDVARLILHGCRKRRLFCPGMPSGLRSFLRKLEQKDWQGFEPVVVELRALSQKTKASGVPWIHILGP
jgi:eukaryotic-like serine/threonine-protein kinase